MIGALQEVEFTTSCVADNVILALRDEWAALEGIPPKNSSKDQAEEPAPSAQNGVLRGIKDVHEAFRLLIGSPSDPRCGALLRHCLSIKGLSTEPWLTSSVFVFVRSLVGTDPDKAMCAQTMADLTPEETIPMSHVEQIRLTYWSLLCKLGAALYSKRLATQGTRVDHGSIEEMLLRRPTSHVGRQVYRVDVVSAYESGTSA